MQRISNWWKLRVEIIAVGLMSASWLHAASLDYLATRASAIVVGTVTSRVESPTQVSFTINVARVLAGNIPGPTVDVVHPQTPRGIRSPSNYTYTVNDSLTGMWFLIAGTSAGKWDVMVSRPPLKLVLPALPTAPTGKYSYPAATRVNEMLVYELAAGVEATNDDPGLYLGAFFSMDSPAIRFVLANCLASVKLEFQAVGLAGSLERGLPDSVHQLAQLWPAIATGAHANGVIAALRDGWRDPTGVKQVASFASDFIPGSEVRGAAIHALASIHTKEALPFLASLLASADVRDQEQATRGLSAFANGCTIQTQDNVVSMEYLKCDQPSTYRTPETFAHFGFRPESPHEESALAAYWQTWWSTHPELH